MSFIPNSNAVPPAPRPNSTPGEVAKVFGVVKKERRCQGQKFKFDKNGMGVYRCFSRDSRIVRIVKKPANIQIEDTSIPEEMKLELQAADSLYADESINEKEWNEMRLRIDAAYRHRILNLEDLKTYSGEIKHLCFGCRDTYLKRHKDKVCHFLDLKLV